MCASYQEEVITHKYDVRVQYVLTQTVAVCVSPQQLGELTEYDVSVCPLILIILLDPGGLGDADDDLLTADVSNFFPFHFSSLLR